ncbi:DNA helicase [Anaerobacillus alkalidiazotrophicus]|uniref:DNA helicase n=1 Tax=Anaerobacillus alkalidiazotrophicus TaxID=472963 RepID=A0A1S2MBN6_9BACI|nr:AAA domain-containing protein [Anaerobacillus alkalidiazotrophicus]OIJ22192.1 DNA helicase [Anaerobacillus alkalidiazotrophicus]
MEYLKEWQQALYIEINHLKKYGSTKYTLKNGHLVLSDKGFTYYFETSVPISIPVGSSICLQWKNRRVEGRMLSSEGNNLLLSLEQSLGDLIDEAILYHDPWELLEELIDRIDECKKSKKKRSRIKQLMEPTEEPKHPLDKLKTNSHELFYRSKYNPTTFVWGPPGTGKTYTLARVASNKYFQGKRVLILSNSNQAVDVLLKEIVDFLTKKSKFIDGDVLRYGTGSKQSMTEPITTEMLLKKREPRLAKERDLVLEERRLLKHDLSNSFSKRDSETLLATEKKLASLQEKIRQKELSFLKKAQIIGTTLAKAATDGAIYEKDYDLVIMDEASMAYVPQAAFAASLGKRVIISGDFKQLPPIAAARHELVDKWLKEDIFHCAGVVEALNDDQLHPHLMLLKEQRRMHPQISAFTNEYIYLAKVYDHPSMKNKRNDLVTRAPFMNMASILVDTSFTGRHCIQEKSSKSRINVWQLFLSFQLIHEAYTAGARSIGYVTPYRAQAMLMDQLLGSVYEKERIEANIISATVHRFQGSERDVMIFDTVDSNPQERPGMLLTGKDSERLVNVAITRTKGKFIQVTDRSFVKNNIYPGKTIRQLVDHQERQGQTITHQKIGTWIKNQHPHLQWMHALKLDRVFQDLKQARTSIIISLPSQMALPNEWREQIAATHSKVKVKIISEQPLTLNHKVEYINEDLPFPFVLIDRQFLWLGLPLEAAKMSHPPYVAVRLDSNKFVEQFLSCLLITGKSTVTNGTQPLFK